MEHFLGFIIDDIWFPIQSLITRLNSQRLSVVTRAWAAYGLHRDFSVFEYLSDCYVILFISGRIIIIVNKTLIIRFTVSSVNFQASILQLPNYYYYYTERRGWRSGKISAFQP